MRAVSRGAGGVWFRPCGTVACVVCCAVGLAVPRALTAGTTYYAAPVPVGRAENWGTDRSRPTTVGAFLKLRAPRPGDTLILLDGEYADPQDLLSALASEGVILRGTETEPILIRAENDGAVTFDGGGTRVPLRMEGSQEDFPNRLYQWVKIVGVNACNSGGTVVALRLCEKCVLHRVCAWDASGFNEHIFSLFRCRDNLLSDCAGWGRGRKIFSVFGNILDTGLEDPENWSHNNVMRRCWGRWEFWGRNQENGPGWGGGHGETYSYNYDAWDTHLENCVSTWQARADPQTLVNPYALFLREGCAACPGGLDEGKLYGCIGYLKGRQDTFPGHVYSCGSDARGHRLKNCLAYVETERGYSAYVSTMTLGPTGRPDAFAGSRLTVYGGVGLSGDFNDGCADWALNGLLILQTRDDGDTDHPSAVGRRGDNIRDVWFYDNYPTGTDWANFGTLGSALLCYNTPDYVHSPDHAGSPCVKPAGCCTNPSAHPGPEFDAAQRGRGTDPRLRAPFSLLRARTNPALRPPGATPMGAHIMWEVDEHGDDTAVHLWPWPMNRRIFEQTGVNVSRDVFELGGGSTPFDYDADGDIDIVDFARFQVCYSGTNAAFADGCEWADYDEDGDVDGLDFVAFQQWMGWTTQGRETPIPDPPPDDYGD